MLEFRWLLDEMRMSFFAQELRNSQPVTSSGWTRLGGS
jgi:hypothetical protein